MPRLCHYVRGVLDVTDVGAVVGELHVFNVDRCILLVQVSGPADPALEGCIVPQVHLPLGVVEELPKEGTLSNLRPSPEALAEPHLPPTLTSPHLQKQ